MTMTKQKNSATFKQKVQKVLHNEDGFSFIEVIIVIAMILILSAILIPSYLGFVETAREANAKISAQNMYTAVQMAKFSIDDPDDDEEFFVELKKLNPALIGINAVVLDNNGGKYVASWDDTLDPGVDPVKTFFTENTCVISVIDPINSGENGYTFTYYQYANGTVYSVRFENGAIVETDSFKNNPPETSDDSSNEENPFA